MCAKIKLRLDNVDGNKYVKIPISLEFNVSGQDEVVERDFIDVECEKAVNPIVDYEKVRFLPLNTNSEEITSLTINLQFLDENGEILPITNYSDIGFVDNDIKYRKSKFLNSFLRLNFYDSDVTTDQNLISQTTIYSKITDDDIVGISEANSDGNDGGDSVGDTTYSVTGTLTANCSSGMGGTITVGSNDVLLSNSSYYYSGFGGGTTVYVNGTVPIYNGTTISLDANQTYMFSSGQVDCSDGLGVSTLTISDAAGQDTVIVTNPNDGGGLPLNANKFPVRFILTNPITNPKGFSEGFYLYHFKSEVIKDAAMPKYLYMRPEFNNAATGETTRFITTTDILPINLLMSNLHVRYLLTRTSSGYYYKIDNTYNDATNISESGSSVILNLYEIRVE